MSILFLDIKLMLKPSRLFKYYWELFGNGDKPIELTIEKLAKLITIQFIELKRAPHIRNLLKRRSRIHIYVQLYFVFEINGVVHRIGSIPLNNLNDSYKIKIRVI